MYIRVRGDLGEDTASEPKRITLAMRPQPYLKLDRFVLNEHSLTDRLRGMVSNFANTVSLSWKSTQPIIVIRLVGHTDNTGAEKYNVGLGDRRAKEVAAALQDKLKGLLGRVRIVVEPSPGESEPTADNRTREGRERNRRVEVFIKTRVTTRPEPEPKSKRLPLDLRLGPETIKRIEERAEAERLLRPIHIPSGPQGKSFKEGLDRKMAERRAPKWLRDLIWRAIFDKNWGLLSSLLSAAGFSGETKESIIETARAAGEVKAR